jgi:hypothetical protein
MRHATRTRSIALTLSVGDAAERERRREELERRRKEALQSKGKFKIPTLDDITVDDLVPVNNVTRKNALHAHEHKNERTRVRAEAYALMMAGPLYRGAEGAADA